MHYMFCISHCIYFSRKKGVVHSMKQSIQVQGKISNLQSIGIKVIKSKEAKAVNYEAYWLTGFPLIISWIRTKK